MSPRNKPIKRLTVHEKYQLVKSPGSHRELVKKFGIGVGTVCEIKKTKDEIIKLFESNCRSDRKNVKISYKSDKFLVFN